MNTVLLFQSIQQWLPFSYARSQIRFTALLFLIILSRSLFVVIELAIFLLCCSSRLITGASSALQAHHRPMSSSTPHLTRPPPQLRVKVWVRGPVCSDLQAQGAESSGPFRASPTRAPSLFFSLSLLLRPSLCCLLFLLPLVRCTDLRARICSGFFLLGCVFFCCSFCAMNRGFGIALLFLSLSCSSDICTLRPDPVRTIFAWDSPLFNFFLFSSPFSFFPLFVSLFVCKRLADGRRKLRLTVPAPFFPLFGLAANAPCRFWLDACIILLLFSCKIFFQFYLHSLDVYCVI